MSCSSINPDGQVFYNLRTRDLKEGGQTARMDALHACPHCGAEEDPFRSLSLLDALVLPVLVETCIRPSLLSRITRGHGCRRGGGGFSHSAIAATRPPGSDRCSRAAMRYRWAAP